MINKEEIDKKAKVKAILKVTLFIVILIALPLYLFIAHRDLIKMYSDVRSVEMLVFEYKGYGALVLLGSQVLQILITVIPGQPIQFACGYLFSPIVALLISIAGSVIGSTIAFYMAKILGRDAVEILAGNSKAMQYLDKLDSRNGYFALFLMYLIPGFPKDPLSYIAGLSEMKYFPYILISTLARIPGMLGSLLIGHFSYLKSYTAIAIVVIIVLAITILCAKKKDAILEWGDRWYDKLNEFSVLKKEK